MLVQGMGYEAQGIHKARAGGPMRYACSRWVHGRTLERDREPRSAMMSLSETSDLRRDRYKYQI